LPWQRDVDAPVVVRGLVVLGMEGRVTSPVNTTPAGRRRISAQTRGVSPIGLRRSTRVSRDDCA
jgi:hypothetical protein